MSIDREWYRNEFVSHEILESHRPIEKELSFYEAVASGNLEAVQENINKKGFIDPVGRGTLSDNPIQNLKYHFIISTAMITRYCIHSGMEQEQAFGLSDFYILKMDKLMNISDIAELHDVMCLDICKKMHALHKKNVLSKPVVLCIDYIYSHLHYRVTVKELAEYLNLSETYLSRLFKKEMGISISQYIIDLKIEKAKNLLQYSDYNLVDIASYLAFSSQSHFIQVFQKSTGQTPHKYRMHTFRTTWDKIKPE